MSADRPLVTIVIPAKNEAAIIGRCLRALSELDYRSDRYEVVVVDNGSSDDTATIALKAGAIVHVKPELTISGLRNYGASQGRSEFIAFVDADVIVAPEWLRNAIASFTDEAACVGCSPRIPSNATWVEKTWHLMVTSRGSRCERDWIASMNMIVRRSVFEAVGGFNESLITCEDVNLGYRIRKAGHKIIYDSRIDAVHYGEAKTLVQLFRKESWRGISNFQGMFSHGVVMRELPSHAVACLYAMLYLSFPVLLFPQGYLKMLWLLLSLSFPLLKGIYIAGRVHMPHQIPKLILIWYVYAFARGWSLFRYLLARHARESERVLPFDVT